MPADSFRDLLCDWIGKDAIIVNPDNAGKAGSTDTFGFESYSARLRAVQVDFVQVSFQAQNRGRLETVEQFIPLERIKRVSLWGEELYLHL